MKNIFVKSYLLIAVSAGLLSGCANSDYYSAPDTTLITYELDTNATVAEINSAATAAPTLYTEDKIIEAYVTSSDEKGTFYKSISFQSIPTDGSAPIGFSVPINVTTLYGKGFSPGRKVYIKLKDLYIARVYGSLQIGDLFEGTIGRISEFEWKKHLFPSATVVNENDFVRPFSLADAYSDANQNTLIELENVQFAESSINRTYFDIDTGGGATNHLLVSSEGGDEQIIRFSSFCPFTGKQVPLKSGKIRGVLTKYEDDFQFIVRYESDIKLTEERFDTTPTLGGSNIQYLGAFTENFESYSASTKVFPKYFNDAFQGTRYWATESFSNNKYLKLSSFSSNSDFQEQNNVAYFIMPIDFTAANTMSFKTQDRFNVGDVLRVYYSTNYVPFANIGDATLVDITNRFTIASGTTGSSSQPFVNSGSYNFPTTLTGNGFIIFEYKGGYSFNPALTTTMHIDDITVN
jgi:hypothetical protein